MLGFIILSFFFFFLSSFMSDKCDSEEKEKGNWGTGGCRSNISQLMKAALFVSGEFSQRQYLLLPRKKSKTTPQRKTGKLKLFNLECNFPCLATFVDKQMWDLGLIKLGMNLAPYGRTFLEMLCTSQHSGLSEILEFPDSCLAEGGA